MPCPRQAVLDNQKFGERYQFLAQHLASGGVEVSVPMGGMRIGEQLSWLGQHTTQPAVSADAEPGTAADGGA